MNCRADLYAKAEIPASLIVNIDHQNAKMTCGKFSTISNGN